MRVKFEYNQDDLLDASKRFLARSKAVRAWRWQGTFLAAGITWVATFAFFFRTPTIGVWVGVVLAALSVAVYPVVYKSSFERRLRRMIKETHGDKKIFVCEVELTPEKLVTNSENTGTTTDWKHVKDILVTNDTIDIFADYGGGVIVRDRAFKSGEEKQQFADLARNYFRAARENEMKQE